MGGLRYNKSIEGGDFTVGRRAIDPQKKKKPVSFTLSTEQHILCEWTAAQLGISASEMIGKLVEKEAKRVARAKQINMPDTNPDQLSL